MAENSSIQWLKRDGISGATWNPWISCQHATYVGSDRREHVHPGCLHCYAEAMMDTRYGRCEWGASGNRVATSPAYWQKPGQWNRKAQRGGYRMPVFPSLCDPFEDWQGPVLDHNGEQLFEEYPYVGEPTRTTRETPIPLMLDDLRRDMFRLIDSTLHIDWLLLTKRPGNVPRMWPETWQQRGAKEHGPMGLGDGIRKRRNVWLCYSASNQETLDYGAPLLLDCADLCSVIGISLEPMLGDVQFSDAIPCGDCGEAEDFSGCRNGGPCIDDRWWGKRNNIGWVIVGVESNGPFVGRLGDFTSEKDWWDAAENVVQQCADAGVACFVKQGPRDGRIVHKPEDFPAPCRVRQFPRSAS